MPGIIFLRMTVVGAESVYMVWAERVYIKVAAVGFTAGIPELVSRLALNHVSGTRNIHVCNYDLKHPRRSEAISDFIFADDSSSLVEAKLRGSPLSGSMNASRLARSCSGGSSFCLSLMSG